MDAERGLKIRILISSVIAIVFLGLFIERMSAPNVVSDPRRPASANSRVIDACDEHDCKTNDSFRDDSKNSGQIQPAEGALIQLTTENSGV